MVRMERVWNTVAVGGVLGALLTTAGVVNLGNLPSWSSSASTPTESLVVAAESAEMPAVSLASVTPGEQQPLPELPIVNAAFEAPEVSIGRLDWMGTDHSRRPRRGWIRRA